MKENGAQGTYLALGYSETRDLGGATRLINGEPTRVGFVPRRRFLLTAGEWLVDGHRLALEYSRDVDYSVREGGTGKSANGISATLTYINRGYFQTDSATLDAERRFSFTEIKVPRAPDR